MKLTITSTVAALSALSLFAQVPEPCYDRWREYQRALSQVEEINAAIERELDNIERWGEIKDQMYADARAEFRNSLDDAKKAAKACAAAASSVNPIKKGVNIIKASVYLTSISGRIGAMLVGVSGVDLRVHAYKRLQELESRLKSAEAAANAAHDRYQECCEGGGGPPAADPTPPGGPSTTPVSTPGGETGSGGPFVERTHEGSGYRVVELSPYRLKIISPCEAGASLRIYSKEDGEDWRTRYNGRAREAQINRSSRASLTPDVSVMLRCTSTSGAVRDYSELRVPSQRR